ncbi:MAG: hypothetical protein KatS3mg004_2997 [Bryobacteraceae bacterium]|nr:MAG: hypothetical protein KatS3mg004_2997 [Bryobacteraceae bacterium]
MKIWTGALRLLLAGWRDWILVASILAGVGGVAVLWLAAPLATAMHVALQAVYTLWALALLCYALWLARRRFAPRGIRLGRLLRRPELWGGLVLAAVAGLLLPWALAHWVLSFESLAAQAASALVRFLIAWVLFSGSVCWLVACLGLLSREDS